MVPLAAAAAVALAFGLAERRAAFAVPRSVWAVASLKGSPRIAAMAFGGAGELHVGQWLETDGGSRAKVSVGSIGEVQVEPNSRLRLVGATATDHRLELARGEMSALIWAPPRLFFVETPSATAIDLGCAYTLKVDDRGDGELRVTAGYVALEHAGREAIIPRDFMCVTRTGAGPGTPFAVDAPAALRAALRRFDFEPRDTSAALKDILASARSADAITLWHLLPSVGAAQRADIYDALARDHAAPAGVTRAGIVAGDAAMRATWAAELGLPVATAHK